VAGGVVAMPTREECPHCGKKIQDWFRVWYPDGEQRGFYKKLNAGDCPDCKKGVVIGFNLEAAPDTMKPRARSRAAAEKWVAFLKDPSLPNLDAFLNSNRLDAQDYKGYGFRP
jgi:endogenous inhibitor of DNA gyrase (YacG/DUF329 family)